MMTLQQDTPGRCSKDRLQDEAKRKTPDALRDTSRKENESRSGWSVGQDGHGYFRMKFSHRGDVSRMQKFRMNGSQDHRKSCHG
jgi:hypothetical protein